MIDLLSVLSYLEVLNGQYTILSHRIDHYHAYDGTEGEEWIITMQNDYPVPRQLSCKQDCFYLMIGKTALLFVFRSTKVNCIIFIPITGITIIWKKKIWQYTKVLPHL